MRWAMLLTGGVLILASRSSAAPADPTPLNTAVVKYCVSREGKRVGAGECAHLATEALRVAGAEFTRVGPDGKQIPETPEPGDYVWGSLLKTYSINPKTGKLADSAPKNKCKPGDILQFKNVKLADGYTYPHHTSIVAEVDKAGNPTSVYQQNVAPPEGGDGRIVRKYKMQPLGLLQGKISVFRPEPPTNPAAFQFTWTNNSKSDTVEFIYYGKKDTLGAPNTVGGHRTVWGNNRADQINVGGKDYVMTSRKAYEFYTTKDGEIGFREVK
jgi:hypothetical protein